MSSLPTFEHKNILVTGGAGFIGSHLCERLLQDKHRVICVDNLSTGYVGHIDALLQNSDFSFIRLDINQPFDLDSFSELAPFKIPFQGIQEIYHLACPTTIKNYGQRKEQATLVTEDEEGILDHLTPRACYDEGKRFSETMFETYRQVHDLEIRMVRLFRTYGPRMSLFDGQLIPEFIINALDGKDLVLYGKKDFRTSLTFITDVIDGLLRIMHASEYEGPVNLGSDVDLRLEEIAQHILRLTDSSSVIVEGEP